MNIPGFIGSLGIMFFGMAGIFTVFIIIYFSVVMFNKLFPDK